MRKIINQTAAILAAGLVGFSPVIIPVSSFALTQDETVYTKLNTDGSLNYLTVNEKLENDENSDTITDYTILSDIENLNGFEEYTKNGTEVVWAANGSDIYYSGTTEKTPPVTMSVKYYLNGEEKTADEIKGQSGDIKIIYSFTNSDRHNYLYTPFVVALSTNMTESENHNIAVTNGKVMTTGRRAMITAIATPGLYESLNLDDLKGSDTITLEFTTDNFALGDTYAIVTPKVLDSSDLAEIFDEIDNLGTSMDTLSSSSKALVSGASELKDGASTLNDAVKTARETIAAANTIDLGTDTLEEISTAAGTLAKKSVSETFAAQKDTQITAVETQIKNGILSNEELTTTLTPYARIIAEASIRSNEQVVAAAEARAKTARESAASATIITGVTDDGTYTYGKLDDTTLSVIYEGTYNKVLDAAVESQIETATTTALQTLASTLATKLASSLAETIVTNTGETLATIAEQVASSTAETVAVEVANAVAKEYSANITDAMDQIIDGTNQLADGATTLSDGMTKFDSEGIQKLVSAVSEIETTANRAERLTELADNYTNFAGLASGASGSTKFILMIDAIK